MKFDNDEIVVWERNCQMIIGGEVVRGKLVVTNKKLAFISRDEPGIFKVSTKGTDLWDLELGRVMGINLHEMKGMGFPMIRVHYKEDDVFLTFPDHEPKPTLAALISFVNSARMIERMMNVMRNLDTSLTNRTLLVGDRLPELKGPLPAKADEDCHQCGKTMLDDEMDKVTTEVNECISCVPETVER